MPTKPWDIFGTDKDVERTGVWLDYGDFKIKIASTGSEHYKRALKQIFKPYERQIQTGTMPDDLAEQKLNEVFAKSIVLDWWCSEWGEHTMWDKDGNRLEFSEKNVLKMLSDMPKLQEMLRDEAQRSENFRRQDEDQAVGNLSKSSNTTSAQEHMPKRSSPPLAPEAHPSRKAS